jgi:hypothetical protein
MGLIDIWWGWVSPVVCPSLNAMKFLLDDARSFLGASVTGPDCRVVGEHPRFCPEGT